MKVQDRCPRQMDFNNFLMCCFSNVIDGTSKSSRNEYYPSLKEDIENLVGKLSQFSSKIIVEYISNFVLKNETARVSQCKRFISMF